MPGLPGSPRSHLVATSAIGLAAGTICADAMQFQPGFCLLAAWVLVGVWLFAFRYSQSRLVLSRRLALLWLFSIVATLSAARWAMQSEANRTNPLRELAQHKRITRLNAVISTVPNEFLRPPGRLGISIDRWQTRCMASCCAVTAGETTHAVHGTVRIYLEGRAAALIRRGDTVQVTGVLSWPDSPGNPGEFDFEQYLTRRGEAGMLFVNGPESITVLERSSSMSPCYWITGLRRSAQQAIDNVVSPQYQSVASALLLGSRDAVREETLDNFVASGTMHLLAISGLHVGILWLLLVRIGHWLLMPWNRRLWLVAGLCVVYMLITDFRPSVVRATAFMVMFTLSQTCLRHVSLAVVAAQTAFFMLLFDPSLIFDTGAQLSFLAILGLTSASHHLPETLTFSDHSDNPVPITWGEHLGAFLRRVRSWLATQYRPMLWILAATMPIIASLFHVVSPIGLVVNVLLIPYTALTLWTGFAAIAIGMISPVLASAPGILFSWMLAGLTWIVEAAASLGAGHLYLPALPSWYVPGWYAILLAAVFIRRSRFRQLAWISLCMLTIAMLWSSADQPDDGHLRCTVLDVGHGSAAVVEYPSGEVLLVDAGALGRGARAADIVSGFLWDRGVRTINSIIVSHADVDHFGALPKLFTRFPTGELLVSQQFAQQEQELTSLADEHAIPIRLVGDGESLVTRNARTDILQASASLLKVAQSDNERSLVVRLQYHGRTILLPGDLEGAALEELLPRLGKAEVLVSPHHGSPGANTPSIAACVQPQHVVVSHYRVRDELSDIYSDATVHFTRHSGAVSVAVSSNGRLSVDPFRDQRR